MATLYVDRKGAAVGVEGEALRVDAGGGETERIPLRLVERLVVAGEARLSSAAIVKLAEAGASVLVLNRKDPAGSAGLGARGLRDASRRLAQYRRVQDEGWRAGWARRLLEIKIGSQRRFVAAAREERPELEHAARRALETLRNALREIPEGVPFRQQECMGLEGAAAAAYFSFYGELFAPALGFRTRNRRPPKDPVNACLSLGYTLLHMEASRTLAGAGLDPMLGFYHEPAAGRESLACDLVETERTRVDAWVWRMFRERELRVEHFRMAGGGCLLGKAGRARFYEGFEPELAAAQRRFRRLAEFVARAVEDGGAGVRGERE